MICSVRCYKMDVWGRQEERLDIALISQRLVWDSKSNASLLGGFGARMKLEDKVIRSWFRRWRWPA